MNWTEKQQRVNHVILNTASNKWQSINLSNLAKELTPDEAKQCFDHCKPLLVKQLQERLDRLIKLRAPEIILYNQRRLIASCERGVQPSLSAIKKRSKEI